MLNHNHKNSECGFGEQLVSYLYGEIEGAERNEFEGHLKKCSACENELAAFQGVHFSIGEWKAQEFTNLETPSIEIPFEKDSQMGTMRADGHVSASGFDRLKNLFSFHPTWSMAGASLAVLAIFSGLAFFVLNSGADRDLAGKDGKNPAFSPTVKVTAEKSISNGNSNQKPLQAVEKSPNQPDVAVPAPNGSKNQPVKVNDNPRSRAKPDNSNKNARKNNPSKNDRNTDSRQKAPGLSPYDDEEDDTLRLADLFTEIDAD